MICISRFFLVPGSRSTFPDRDPDPDPKHCILGLNGSAEIQDNIIQDDPVKIQLLDENIDPLKIQLLDENINDNPENLKLLDELTSFKTEPEDLEEADELEEPEDINDPEKIDEPEDLNDPDELDEDPDRDIPVFIGKT